MKIVILSAARDDLADGFQFYENQAEGLGGYFLESLFSDIDSLILYAGIHRKVFWQPSLALKAIPIRNLLHDKPGHDFRQSRPRLPQKPEISPQKIAGIN